MKLMASHAVVMGAALVAATAMAQTSTPGAADSQPASAIQGDTLEEVVVTAERRSENLQRTAVAVSVRDGDDLLQQGKFTVNQILENIPSVTLQAPPSSGTNVLDSPANAIGIRGVQANGQVQGSAAAVVPAVALYVDGVVNGLGGSYDITRVEVLRGPQGTLYGRSATAGVVNIHTANPVLGRYTGNAAIEVGEYSLQHYSGAINLPAGDTLALRVSGNHYKRDGYYAPQGGQVDTTDARAKLLFQPNVNLSVLVGFAYQGNNEHSGEYNGTITGTGTGDVVYTSPVPLGDGFDQTRQYWAQVDWNLGFATLTYIPALRTFEERTRAYTRPGPGVIATLDLQISHDYFHTEELRLTSNSTSPLSWQTGVFYYHNSLSFTSLGNVAGGPFPPTGLILTSALPEDRLTENSGLFAEATYEVASATRVTAGVRGDYTKVQTTQVNCQGPVGVPFAPGACLTLGPDEGTRNWRNFTYKARIEHDLTANNLLYGSVSSAFLPGDVAITTGATGALVIAAYDAETLTAFEIGSKNRFVDDRLQINGDVFYYRYGGHQVPIQIGQLGGAGGAPLYNTMSNPARMLGAELEVLFQPTRADRFGLNLSYLDGYYVDKSAAFADGVANSHLSNVIPWIIDPSYSHTFGLPNNQTLTFLAEALFHSGYLTVDLPAVYYAAGLEPYVRNGDTLQGNFTLTWNLASRYSLSAYVRNVSDVRYKTGATLTTTVPTANTATLSEPRTFGMVASARF